MADLFADRIDHKTTWRAAVRQAWISALTYARTAGTLQHLEEVMELEKDADTDIREMWRRTR
ncbi:MAG: hypothetical protein HN348_09640 [Proteobacteria bacterium]|nr:hypothetical protein [Pseudomonadota bacterium]